MRSRRDLPPAMGQRRIQVSGASPAGQRRREQARRRSWCCCSAMLLFSLLVAVFAFRGLIGSALSREAEPEPEQAAFPLEIATQQASYMRYDLIPVTVRLIDRYGNAVSDEPPEVVVTRDGEVVKTVGHFPEAVKLRWDGQREAWVGHWPPGWNPEPGTYRVEARMQIDPTEWTWDGARTEAEKDADEIAPEGAAWAISQVSFDLNARERPEMEPGMCAATWEFDFRDTFRGPDGSSGDWRKLFDWVEYVGADTLWFRGAVTEAAGEALTLEQPFKPLNLDAIPRLGAEAHRRGLKFGAWAVAYSTYPRANTDRKPDYDFAIDVSRSTGATSEHNFISLLDERRVDHVAEFFRQMQASEHVDHVGLDYMRSDRGGYEMTERFTREMPVELPDGWGGWDENRRMRWMAVKIEEQWRASGDPDFYEAWNWWRAHIGAGIVRRILEKSQVTKPTWIFVLSWLHGIQHGQDPLMFTDAGITMLAPMLYQVPNRGHFDTLTRSWHNYINEGQINLVPGDQVDFYWHQSLKDPPAPEELYDRTVVAHREFINGGHSQGAFWHDINRAASPSNLGPYSGREWALAGAAAFSAVRDTWKVYPLRAELDAPDSAGIASQFGVKVKLTNLTNQPVTDVRISLCDTPHMVGVGLTEAPEGELFGEPYAEVAQIPPGATVEMPITVRIAQANAERLNKTMLALRVTWAGGEFDEPVRNELPRTIVLMKYVTGR
ncbi:MAG: hypothetical protein ACOX9R_12475 [Armatimonadota bacterium]|jgi:hypothetical protein